MEDGCSLYGVFDGHDGSKLSNFVAQRIPAELLFDQLSGKETDQEIKDVLQQVSSIIILGRYHRIQNYNTLLSSVFNIRIFLHWRKTGYNI